MKHPTQKIIEAEDKVIRFTENRIVNYLLELATASGYSLNNIAGDFDTEIGEKDNEDYTQLMQLIGYSISGYGGLNSVKHKDALKFDRKAQKFCEDNKL